MDRVARRAAVLSCSRRFLARGGVGYPVDREDAQRCARRVGSGGIMSVDVTRSKSKTDQAASQPKRVEHFTVSERAARGKAARADVPRSSHADWKPLAAPSRSRRAARGAGADPGAGARADPLRPHARVAVHVLSRRRATSWPPISRAAPDGPPRAALRRRAPLELRRLRGSRPPASSSASTTSTRRCPVPSSGM